MSYKEGIHQSTGLGENKINYGQQREEFHCGMDKRDYKTAARC